MKKIRGEDRSVKPLLGQKFRTGYYQRDDKWEPEQIRELIEALQILDRAIYSGEMDSWDGGEHLWKTFSSVRKSMVHKPNEKRWNPFRNKPYSALDELWPEHKSSIS